MLRRDGDDGPRRRQAWRPNGPAGSALYPLPRINPIAAGFSQIRDSAASNRMRAGCTPIFFRIVRYAIPYFHGQQSQRSASSPNRPRRCCPPSTSGDVSVFSFHLTGARGRRSKFQLLARVNPPAFSLRRVGDIACAGKVIAWTWPPHEGSGSRCRVTSNKSARRASASDNLNEQVSVLSLATTPYSPRRKPLHRFLAFQCPRGRNLGIA